MSFRSLMIVLAMIAACGNSIGCNKFNLGTATSEEDDFSDFADFDSEASQTPQSTGDVQHADHHSPAKPSGDNVQLANYEESQVTASPQELTIQLPVGARFPLIKTVDQRLTQQTPTGPVVGHTHLELRLSLLVDEQRQGARRLTVRYHRVKYSQDLGGVPVEYDSDHPPAITPPSALAYSGLKDNTFSFWLGADNQPGELVGYQEFLRRCVAQIPESQRNQVLQQLLSLGSEHGVANFVDDSIGLLPNLNDPQLSGKPLQIGSSWMVGNANPGAAQSGMKCLIKELTPQVAQIGLVGEITPSTYVDDARNLTLTIRGGQCSGHCTVDRNTGMPMQSRIDRRVEMIAKLPDGSEIPQTKEVITTVTAFLDQGTPGVVPAQPVGMLGQPAR